MGKSKYLQSNLKAAQESLKEQENKNSEAFTNDFWKPDLEKGKEEVEYIIRFIPNPDSTNGSHSVQRNSHMIEYPNGKFVYLACPAKPARSKKWDCPICEEVDPWWNGDQHAQNKAKRWYARPRYFSNIYIVSDERDDRANEGKIKIFEYGKSIYQMGTKILIGDEEMDKVGIEYSHLFEGVNFKLVVKRITDERGKSLPTYNDSDFFVKPGPLKKSNGDVLQPDDADEFMEKAFSLNFKILNDDVFKSTEELRHIHENQGMTEKGDESKSDKSEKTVERITVRNPSPSKQIIAEKEVTENVRPTEVKTEVKKAVQTTQDDDDDLAKLLSEEDDD